jgi:hypothetical protein
VRVKTALVTGSPERVEQVVAALTAAGAEAVAVTEVDRLDDQVRSLPPGVLSAYIQLPMALRPAGETMVSRVRDFLDRGLLARFRLVETVLPALSAPGQVLLVAGHTPIDLTDDREARFAFLRVLAHAIRADRPPAEIQVRLVDRRQSPDEIARMALADAPPPDRLPAAEFASGEAERNYQDWRTEVLGLVSVEY